jgi:hypothetical protein
MSGGKAINTIFLAGEFVHPTPIPSGMQITTVYFLTGTAGMRVFSNLQILLAQSTITTLTSGAFYAGPYDTVYYKDTSTLVSTSGGWMPVVLKHPFPYDPTKSLIMFTGVCSFTGTGTTVYNSTLTGVRRVWSVGGCPFAPYASGDVNVVNFGVDVIPATPLPPVLVYPSNNATGIPTALTFVWNKSAGATNYWWQLTTDTTSLANLQNDSTLTDSTKAISGLNNFTNYFWRVKSKNAAGWGNYSGWFKFTTVLPIPSAPTLLSPTNGGALGTPQILKWSHVQYATSYRIQITTGADSITFSSPVWDTSGVADTTVLVPIGKLAYNTKYWWRVNSANTSGTGPYSIIFTFTTLPDPTALSMANFIPVICPKYMSSGTSTRLPLVIRGTIQGLIPNKTYRYYNLLAVRTDLGTTALGAGIIMLIDSNGTFIYTSLGSLTTSGQYLTFVANASGSFTGWFGNLNSGNARFTAGNYVYPAVCIGDSVGNVIARYAMNDSIQVLSLNLATSPPYGTGVYGISLGLPKNIITLYDNIAGTGKPLATTWLEQTGNTLPSVVQYYTDSVNAFNGRWGSILPNTLASGLQRVEQRALSNGAILTFNTSSTGLWPSGVNTVNPSGGTTAIRLPLMDAPLMNPPILISPANGSVDLIVTPTLLWNSSIMATSYRVQISTDSAAFSTLAYDTAGLTALTITVPSSKLTTNTKYYWRVNAANSVGSTLWSTVWNFKTRPNLPNAPILVYPPGNGVVTNPVTFVWRKAIETLSKNSVENKKMKNVFGKSQPLTISNYWLEYTTDSTFATGIVRDSTITDTTKTLTLGISTPYWWRVRAKNQIGWGPFSAAWRFGVSPGGLQLIFKGYLEGFWNGASQVTDTVRIYLANSTAPYAYVDTAKIVLSSTGTASPLFSRASNGSYYIILRHRNHLETWSRLPQVFATGTPVNYDFTTDSAKAFGYNMKKVGGVWVIYGGDPNQDGSIDADDIPIFISQYGLTGYLSCDFNGDNDVNANDVAIIVANFGLTKVIPGMIIDPPEIRKQKQMTKKHELNEMLKQIKNKKEGKIIKAD